MHTFPSLSATRAVIARPGFHSALAIRESADTGLLAQPDLHPTQSFALVDLIASERLLILANGIHVEVLGIEISALSGEPVDLAHVLILDRDHHGCTAWVPTVWLQAA